MGYNCDLDKGKIITIDHGYNCVKNFYTANVFGELSNSYSIDSHVLLEVVKTFAKHISLPKVGFIEYVKPMKYPAIMLACVKAPEVSPVLAIEAAKTNHFVETPPFPTKGRRIYSHIFQTRVQKGSARLMSKLR
jgi:hypothetical protein